MSADSAAVAAVLERIAGFLEFREENPFRIRAFRNAAKAVLAVPGPLADALDTGVLAATPGIGPATLALVTEVVATGRSAYEEQLAREVPPGLLEMLGIPGLGATRIRQLHQGLQIETLTQLEAAARDGRLARLPGFGPRTAEKVLKGIGFVRKTQPFRLSIQAAAEAEALRAALERTPGISRALVAGEVRRACEVVGALAFVAVSDLTAEALLPQLTASAGFAALVREDDTRLSFRSPAGSPASLRVTSVSDAGAALVAATGNPAHLGLLAAQAAQQGYRLEAAALYHGQRRVATPDESTLYRTLGLAEIPPELREGADEVTRARDGTLPRLLEPPDLRGLLHCHTTYSDGSLGVADLARAAAQAGYDYLGVTDHSRSAAYAGGMSEAEVHRQWAEIEALNAAGGIRILKGIESDILADGALDYDDATLAGFDFVIGSIHSRLSLGPSEMTARVLGALAHPRLTILGHPTGRLLLSREPYPLDLDQVFGAAAAAGVALEINGDPHRLDLDWRLVRRARESGVLFTIGADAHRPGDLAYPAHAVAMARKGGLEPSHVVNTRPVAEFLRFARARSG